MAFQKVTEHGMFLGIAAELGGSNSKQFNEKQFKAVMGTRGYYDFDGNLLTARSAVFGSRT